MVQFSEGAQNRLINLGIKIREAAQPRDVEFIERKIHVPENKFLISVEVPRFCGPVRSQIAKGSLRRRAAEAASQHDAFCRKTPGSEKGRRAVIANDEVRMNQVEETAPTRSQSRQLFTPPETAIVQNVREAARSVDLPNRGT
jgi:hypothetical protein